MQLRQGPGRGRPLPSLDGAQGACSTLWVGECPSRCLVPKPGWVPKELGGQGPMQPPAGFGIPGLGSDGLPVSPLVARAGPQASNPRRRPEQGACSGPCLRANPLQTCVVSTGGTECRQEGIPGALLSSRQYSSQQLEFNAWDPCTEQAEGRHGHGPTPSPPLRWSKR